MSDIDLFYTDEEMAEKMGYKDSDARSAIKTLSESVSRGTFPFQPIKMGNKRIWPRELIELQLKQAINDQTEFKVAVGGRVR